jgi:hypothetical protein
MPIIREEIPILQGNIKTSHYLAEGRLIPEQQYTAASSALDKPASGTLLSKARGIAAYSVMRLFHAAQDKEEPQDIILGPSLGEGIGASTYKVRYGETKNGERVAIKIYDPEKQAPNGFCVAKRKMSPLLPKQKCPLPVTRMAAWD